MSTPTPLEGKGADLQDMIMAYQASGIKTSKPDFFTHISFRRK
jgi:hypothetical protein